MTNAQRKIGSGFGADTTAAEVLHGLDLSGKLAVVTGGYSGLGLETTRALTDAGAHVVVPARRLDTAKQALDGLGEVDELDLADLESVRGFAGRFLASGRRIDLLIDSAAIMATPETRVGPGWEVQFATNHLGHFALVNRLWPAIAPGARVVSVSSRGHHFSPIRWDDPWFEQGYDKYLAYGQAKTANALFAVHLDKLGQASGVRAFSVHPGSILTPLQRHVPREEQIENGWIDEEGNSAGRFKTPEQGAATQVWAATSPQLADLGGLYCEDCEVAELASDEELPSSGGRPPVRLGVRDYAVDPEQAARLWAFSAELTGVNAFG
ncbi:SDR family NAD(P)-dependent oxidoreductase [Amycolatopsis acidiphila]|uniref:Probable oxidoreductase n=1 Tax=Amycolatopsis acidiphila TaxID=715473 RepID=A0A558A6H3_9PSEU|nr:SDR family NAD(P)-dependent oxidoreductase [Amycolatopsis acidiphila]TVT19846.1 SDR family NAD(P)-dependent oxidoreductase [Amycolatopsis acidiphila]UIJ58754.1 SDR family NAD(P)-dependent oxidoreductase [Amycolatopsis acidiphila]GHG71742.1 oxidoreductase [Amycolatopsis acidiphila]